MPFLNTPQEIEIKILKKNPQSQEKYERKLCGKNSADL